MVLLIDEIDKTDQEFEAMLLEVLSDFQISIPELGVVEAKTHPLVLLTSNNSRELTEALKRRCLYLWLDYPDVERELEIVRLHAPELDEHVARKLVEVVHMVRALDLKKPPSIAESIDWARALMLLGADDIDQAVLRADDVDHRQAPHRPRRGRRARGREAGRWNPRSRPASGLGRPGLYGGMPEPGPPGLPARLLELADELRNEGVAVGTSELLDAFEALDAVTLDRAGGLPRGAGRDAREVAGGPARVRRCVFDRFFFRAVEREAVERGLREQRFEGGERLDIDELRERIREAMRAGVGRRDARPGAAGDRGVRAPGRGLRRDRRGRAADPAGARPEGRVGRAPTLPDPDAVPQDRLREFERHLRRELERR